jgi:excisionase family DNA binding protein
MIPRLLTPDEAAAVLGVRRKTIYQLSHERRIETVKIGRTLRIPADAIERMIRRGTRNALA